MSLARTKWSLRWALWPSILFAIHRLILIAASAISLAIQPALFHDQPAGAATLVAGMVRWDSGWFAWIARDGYTTAMQTNFFPLFPLLGWTTAAVSGLDVMTSLVVVANAAGWVATLAVYAVFCQFSEAKVARAATLLWICWPYSFFHAAAYPETLMIAGTALAILWAARGRHIGGGVALGAAVLARHLSALAWLSMLFLAVCRAPTAGAQRTRRQFFIGTAVAAGVVLIYPVFLVIRFGDPLVWMRGALNVRGAGLVGNHHSHLFAGKL